MSIRIGGGCVGRYALNTKDMSTAEIRLLQNNEHKQSWSQIDMCLKNNIFFIVNIDTYMTGGRWLPNDAQLRAFTEDTVAKLRNRGATKKDCRFTWDNEPMEYSDVGNYLHRLEVIHDQLVGRFDLGAGNENMPLGRDKGLYVALAQRQHLYEVFDIHTQNGFNTNHNIWSNINYYKGLKNQYNIKRISCTEGSAFFKLPSQYSLLLEQLKACESIGCEDFCFVFADWITNNVENENGMSMCIDGVPKDLAIYNDLVRIVKEKKPIEPIEEDDMELVNLKIGSKNNQVKWLQDILLNEYQVPNPGGIDGAFGPQTDQQVRDYQEEYDLTIDGIVGLNTTMKLINESSDPKKWYRNLVIYVSFK